MKSHSSSSSKIQWGKLTSLNPNFNNITLSTNPTSFGFTSPLQESTNKKSSKRDKCRIYQHKQDDFISYLGSSFAIQVNDQALKKGEDFKIHSGDVIKVIIKDQRHEGPLEYIFSSELKQAQKETMKRDREETEELVILEKKVKFQEDFEKESKCLICEKMIYECVSVAPCLHSFCMDCFMGHLRGSQECPDCRERFVEFRKDVFLNNLIEGYEESGYQRDRSPEECRKINEKLNIERIFARFEYADKSVYEGEWKKCRKDGKGKMEYGKGAVYEGDWKNGKREGKGKMIYTTNGDVYEGEWRNDARNGQGKRIYENKFIYEGEWENDARHGRGRMTMCSNGSTYEGNWIEGRIQRI